MGLTAQSNVIYTANIGGYDALAPIDSRYINDSWLAVCFTDEPESVPAPWLAVRVDTDLYGDLPPVAIAKWHKIQPEQFLLPHLADAPENILWIDANIQIGRHLDDILGEFPLESNFCTQRHSAVHTFFGEIRAARGFPRPYIPDTRDKSEAMEADYRRRGMIDEDGLSNHNNVILRRPCERNTILQAAWWDEFHGYGVWRDQISLRAAAQMTGIEFDMIHELNRKGLRWARHACLMPARRERRRATLRRGHV